MNVNLNNSFYIRPKNFSQERGTALKTGETFSDTITTVFEKVKTDQYARSASFTTPKTHGKLEDEDYGYLSSKWNPTKMSQDDYDEFLDYLQNEGIITEEDKKYVGYGGITSVSREPRSWYTPCETTVDDFADGNLLAYMRFKSTIIYDTNVPDGKRRENLYKTITRVLEGMVR